MLHEIKSVTDNSANSQMTQASTAIITYITSIKSANNDALKTLVTNLANQYAELTGNDQYKKALVD